MYFQKQTYDCFIVVIIRFLNKVKVEKCSFVILLKGLTINEIRKYLIFKHC